MSLLDSTRTLGVPGGSFHADTSMSQSACGGKGGSTISDCNLESDLSSDISSGHIVTCNGRMDQYQVRSPSPLSRRGGTTYQRHTRRISFFLRARGQGDREGFLGRLYPIF